MCFLVGLVAVSSADIGAAAVDEERHAGDEIGLSEARNALHWPRPVAHLPAQRHAASRSVATWARFRRSPVRGCDRHRVSIRPGRTGRWRNAASAFWIATRLQSDDRCLVAL